MAAAAETDPTSAAGVDANTKFLSLSAGATHSCGIKANSAVACWGDNGNGQSDPTSGIQGVDANTRFLAVSAGTVHSCGIKADGAAACWGFDGHGRASPSSSSQGVDADTRFLSLSAGGNHSCGIKADGAAACWGLNDDGQADPTSGAQSIDANTRFLAVSAGSLHSCGIRADGAAACWGFDGNKEASPPPDSFSRTLDVFRLAERATTLAAQDGGEPVQFNEVTEVEPLHPRLTLREGETTTLALFRVLSGQANPITITLTIGESDKRFLDFKPAQLVISEAGGTATASVTAIDNEDIAVIDPIDIMLSLTGDNARLTPTETITAAIENDDFYTVGFERRAITVEEGASEIAQLSLSPALTGASTVTVALSVSDTRQITVEPEAVVFSATSLSFDVAVSATDDATPEIKDTFTVSPTPLRDIPPAKAGVELTVIVPENDTPTVRVIAERTMISEGELASVFIAADINRELSIDMALSGPTGIQSRAVFAPPSLTLGPDNPSALFSILAVPNEEPQAADIAFNIDLTTAFSPQPELPSLTFTIPPNDLAAHASSAVEFTLENKEAIQTMTIDITPPLRGDKSFVVSSDDPRLVVKTGIITSDQPSFPVELALTEDTILGRGESLSLNIIHLDSWRQRSAQTQLGAGRDYTCGIKADGRAACWGRGDNNQTSPASSPDADADTRFLAISAGPLPQLRHQGG